MASGFGLTTVFLGFDRQGSITVFAAVLLALITLLTNYTHVDLLEIAAAVAAASPQSALAWSISQPPSDADLEDTYGKK